MAFNDAQKKAIRHGDGPALVLAGPGSGKTTVITSRVRFLTEKRGVSPGNILVITFTRAAATEMKERYERLTENKGGRVAFGTFHSIFFMILKLAYRYEASQIVKEDEQLRVIREMAERMRLEPEDEREFAAAVLSEISSVKGELISLSGYHAKSCSSEAFGRLYKGYEDWLRRQGKLDFDDMLVMCYELFKERKDILRLWQEKYQYILIDEFQDINRLQYEVVKMLALPRNNLFIVGDDDQSIYRFRGARPELMLGFEKDYPGAERILLDMNYRSSSQITEAAGQLVRHNRIRFPKEIRAARGAGRPICIRQWADGREETLEVAKELRDYARMGIAYEDIAVLYRTNQGPRLLVERLMEYNIPFTMGDNLPNLYEHWIAKNIISYIRIARGELSRSLVLSVINRPPRYISRDAFEGKRVSWEALKSFYQDRNWMLDRIEQLEYDLKMISTMAPVAAINYIRKAVGYDDYIREYAEERRIGPEEFFEVLDALQESAGGFQTTMQWFEHIEEYGKQLKNRSAFRENRERGVSLMTMHSSKGLEFKVVYILDANEGVTPHKKAVLEPDMEEERRMFYVAMTRAKERLHIYYVKERYHKKQTVSRFVEEIGG